MTSDSPAEMTTPAARLEIDRLVAEHHAELYRYAYRLSGQAADAEDLTQQTFLVAHNKLDQVRAAESCRAWLFAVLRNCFLKSVRQASPLLASNLEVSLETIADDAADDQAIDREQLQRALDELPAEFRVVLVMFYFEECSYREIAERLELPLGTVMSRLSRAKSHLRSRLIEREAVAAAMSSDGQRPANRG